MQRIPEKGPGILQRENIYNMLQDYKPKEYAIKQDDISITTFIKVEHNIQKKGKESLNYI